MSTVRNEQRVRGAAAIALAVLSTLALAAPALAKPGHGAGGNADAAAACDGGYLNRTDAAGNAFRNSGACVSYAAHGGRLMPVAVNPFSVAYTAFGASGFRATVTGTGMSPDSGVDFVLTWGGEPVFIGHMADEAGNVTFTDSGACTSLGSTLTSVSVTGTPLAGRVHGVRAPATRRIGVPHASLSGSPVDRLALGIGR